MAEERYLGECGCVSSRVVPGEAACRCLSRVPEFSRLVPPPRRRAGVRAAGGAGLAALPAVTRGAGGGFVTMANLFSAAIRTSEPFAGNLSFPDLQAAQTSLTSLGLLSRNSRCTESCRVRGSGDLAPSALWGTGCYSGFHVSVNADFEQILEVRCWCAVL